MSRAVVALIGLAVLLMAGTAALDAGLATAGETTRIENETFTPSAGNVTVLDNSQIGGAYYAQNVTVYDENDNVTDYGQDYLWYEGNGTVEAVSGGQLDGDANASITYSYQQPTAEQRSLASLYSNIPAAVGLFLPIGALLFFWMVVS